MSAVLFDLDDFEETRVVWEPIYKPFTLVGIIAPNRCRDCGVKCGANQGGGNRRGSFVVCDECAALDTLRPSAQSGRVASHWGVTSDESEVDGLRSEQEKRRAIYLRRAEAVAA